MGRPRQHGPGVRIEGQELYAKFEQFHREILGDREVLKWAELSVEEKQVWDSMVEELWERVK